jgi:hypothetical protein
MSSVDPYTRVGTAVACGLDLTRSPGAERANLSCLGAPRDVQFQRAEEVDRLEVSSCLGSERGGVQRVAPDRRSPIVT